MDLYVQFYENQGKYFFDMKEYEDRNLEILREEIRFGKEPEKIRIINDIPKLKFNEELVLSSPELKEEAIKLMFHDCLNSDSSIVRYLCDSTDIDEELKARVFLQLFESFLRYELKWYLNPKSEKGKSYAVFYLDRVEPLDVFEGCHAPCFKVTIPKEVIKKHYPDCERETYGAPQFFDIEKLEKDEMLQFIIPAYYHDLGWFDRKHIRDNKEKMEWLTRHWISSLFASLD